MVRGRLNDQWRRGSEVHYGDGSASAIQLRQGAPYSVLCSATASVMTQGGWSATGGALDTAQGYAAFSGVIGTNTPVRFDYLWAVFSDDDIAYFTGIGGGVAGAALEGIKWLMGDAWKRARWASPDGTQYDDSKALTNLKALYDVLKDEAQGGEGGPEGGFESWSVAQGEY